MSDINMTLEESIALAEKLQKGYAKMESIERDIASKRDEIRRPLTQYRRHSFFKFFWPSFIVADISFVVAILLCPVFIEEFPKLYGLVILIVLLIPVAILVIGATVAKKKAREANKSIEYAQEDELNKKDELRDKVKELEHEYNSLSISVGSYSDIVPAAYRKSSAMARVKLLLQSGKADNFADALEKCKS
ncbi:MAG: hypothetical protein IKZ29_06165 [Clostridiales bacterium]|nr:hypothetical protein [Clostridiales bacterium]